MSAYYSKVKKYYAMGLWNLTRVKNAVTMGWITEEEYTEITGETYE